MLALALLLSIQVLGCASPEADQVRRLIALELQGVAVTAVELRCGPATRLEVQIGNHRDARTFPADVLTRTGGPRLVAVAAADLVDDLQARPPPPRARSTPPASPLASRIYGGVVFRSRLTDGQLGGGVAWQLQRGVAILEAQASAFSPTTTVHPEGETTATRYDGALAIGAAGPVVSAQLQGLLGWRVGHAGFEGVAGGDTRTVSGIYGGPFLATRLEIPTRFVRLSLASDVGWSVWTVRGRIGGAVVEAEDGGWYAVALRFGFEL